MKNRNVVTPNFRARGAFTLVELLVVITIIAILAAAVSRTIGFVNSMQDRSRASAELSSMGTALAAFKGMYGDYPRTNEKNDSNGPQRLYRCLAGLTVMRVEGSQIVFSDVRKDQNLRSFLDVSAMNVGLAGDPDDPKYNPYEPIDFDNAKACFIDPWGVPYHYYYDSSTMVGGVGSWEGTSFILFSSGPDRQHAETRSMYSNGIMPEDDVYRDVEVKEKDKTTYPNVDNIVYGFDN